jgi:hypothetical protein
MLEGVETQITTSDEKGEIWHVFLNHIRLVGKKRIGTINAVDEYATRNTGDTDIELPEEIEITDGQVKIISEQETDSAENVSKHLVAKSLLASVGAATLTGTAIFIYRQHQASKKK